MRCSSTHQQSMNCNVQSCHILNRSIHGDRLHFIGVNIITHLLLHSLTFHAHHGPANCLRMKGTFLNFMFLWMQFDHLNTLFIHTHGHFLALLLRVVLLHLLHPQLALHNLLLLLSDGFCLGHKFQLANWPFFLHHFVRHFYFTLVLEP